MNNYSIISTRTHKYIHFSINFNLIELSYTLLLDNLCILYDGFSSREVWDVKLCVLDGWKVLMKRF